MPGKQIGAQMTREELDAQIAALGDTEGKLDELRRRYPNLGITSWTRENRVQM